MGIRRARLSTGAFCLRNAQRFWRLPLADCRDGSLVNQQFAFARWTLAPRLNDDGVHRRIDDVLFAERAGKGMVEEIEFDGAARGKMVTKTAFAFLSPPPKVARPMRS